MRIVSIDQTLDDEIIRLAVSCLKNGGVVIYPTETCYGIGVDATNNLAVEKLLKYKGSRKGKPISVAIASAGMAREYVEFNPTTENLFKNFLPGPITVICSGKHKVASSLESENGTLGVRFPRHDFAIDIIKAFGKPITATSANVSGGKTPYSVSDILDNIPDAKKELIDLIIDADNLVHHAPSTIIDTTLNEPKILRQGEFIFDNVDIETYISNNVEETIKIGEKLIINNEKLIKKRCFIFALQGELGAGKTQFAKGVARGLGIKENIKSPTFILCSEYPFHRHTFYHIDTWRMQNKSELLDIGFEKMLMSGNVIVIEWGQKVFDVLKKMEKRKDVKIVWVKIETVGKNERKITMSFPI